MDASNAQVRPGLVWILLRRWYFTFVGLLVTAGLCAGAVMLVPAKYQASASLLLLPPKTTVGNGGNPFLSLSGLQGATDVVARAMMDPSTASKLRLSGAVGKYTATRDLTTSGPVILVIVEGSNPAETLTTLQQVVEQVGPTFLALQQAIDVPTSALVTTTVIKTDVAASPVRKSQIRSVLVAAALGVVLTMLVVGLVDSRLRRRSEARAAVAGANLPVPLTASTEISESHPDTRQLIREPTSIMISKRQRPDGPTRWTVRARGSAGQRHDRQL